MAFYKKWLGISGKFPDELFHPLEKYIEIWYNKYKHVKSTFEGDIYG